MRRSSFGVIGVVLFAFVAAADSRAATPSSPPDEFFIVSSVDAGRGTLVVKRPTEVTLTIRVTPRTVCRAENGRAVRLSDLRAGDTIFVAFARDPAGQPVAATIRQGIMTPTELRRRYLHF